MDLIEMLDNMSDDSDISDDEACGAFEEEFKKEDDVEKEVDDDDDEVKEEVEEEDDNDDLEAWEAFEEEFKACAGGKKEDDEVEEEVDDDDDEVEEEVEEEHDNDYNDLEVLEDPKVSGVDVLAPGPPDEPRKFRMNLKRLSERPPAEEEAGKEKKEEEEEVVAQTLVVPPKRVTFKVGLDRNSELRDEVPKSPVVRFESASSAKRQSEDGLPDPKRIRREIVEVPQPGNSREQIRGVVTASGPLSHSREQQQKPFNQQRPVVQQNGTQSYQQMSVVQQNRTQSYQQVPFPQQNGTQYRQAPYFQQNGTQPYQPVSFLQQAGTSAYQQVPSAQQFNISMQVPFSQTGQPAACHQMYVQPYNFPNFPAQPQPHPPFYQANAAQHPSVLLPKIKITASECAKLACSDAIFRKAVETRANRNRQLQYPTPNQAPIRTYIVNGNQIKQVNVSAALKVVPNVGNACVHRR